MALEAEYVSAQTETETMYFLSGSEEGQLLLPYDIVGITPGYYVIVGKGNHGHRLAIMGAMAAVQDDLTQAQKYLRMAAHVQQMHMSDPVGWRTVTRGKPAKKQSWGSERPAFANGALCYLNARDAPVVEAQVAAGALDLMSKHTVISAEYVPLLCMVYNTVYAMWNICHGKPACLAGRAAYVFVRAAILCDFRWYDAGGVMQSTALTYQTIHRRNEWADVLELFDDGVFVAEGERPSSALCRGRKARMPPVFLVNPNYEQTGEKPRLTDAALAAVVCMAKHVIAATSR